MMKATQEAASQLGSGGGLFDAAALNRSLTHLGSARTLLSRLEARLPVTIGVIGASVAQEGGCFQEHRRCAAYNGLQKGFAKGFAVRFLEHLNATWPHPQHSLTNGALDATPPRMMLPCMFTHLPGTLHVVLIEYGSMAQFVKPAGVEALVRRLLLFVPPPSLVFVNVRRFCNAKAEATRAANETVKLWPRKGPIARAERRVFEPLCRRYNASCVSLHAAAWPLLSNRSLQVRDVAADCTPRDPNRATSHARCACATAVLVAGLHPSTGRRGPALLAQLLAHWLAAVRAAPRRAPHEGAGWVEPLHNR
jgi:hypothetical protein